MSVDTVIKTLGQAKVLASPAKSKRAARGGEPPKKPPGSRGNFGDNDSGDDGLDEIVARLNDEFALVLMGSRAIIMREMPGARQ